MKIIQKNPLNMSNEEKKRSEASEMWAKYKQIVKAEKAEWLKKNTDECERVCGELGIDIRPLNNGLQLKLIDGEVSIDFWPTHQKFGVKGRFFNGDIEKTIKQVFKK